MEHLPPVGWANVATKDDLVRLADRVDARFAEVDARFAHVDARFDSMKAQLDARFAQVDARFAQVDARFAQIDARFGVLDANVRSSIDRAIRTSTLVTVGVLGTLTTVVTTLANL